MAEGASSTRPKGRSKASAKSPASSSKDSSKSSSASNDPATSSGRRVIIRLVGDKAMSVIRKDFDEAKVMARDARKSRAYLYPIKGICYFFSVRALWGPFLNSLGPFSILSISVFTVMLMLAYLPQLAILVFVHGPLAVFTTLLLILSESSAIISVISRVWLLRDALLDTFDAALLSRKHTDLVNEGRDIQPGSNPMQKLGKIRKFPFPHISRVAAFRYLMYLPLNCIPAVGTFAFLFFQGRKRGEVCHDRYFQLKNWSSSRRIDWLDTHRGSYTSFGVVATLLEMIPFLSMLFTYTNAVGAALWAADLEDYTSVLATETAPNLRQKAEDVEENQ